MADELTPYEALVSFLYRAPIGLLEIGGDGVIAMANPMAVNLLMPIAKDGALDNLFDCLADLAPTLRTQAEALCITDGDELELRIRGHIDGQMLLLRMSRLDPTRLMVSVSDVTAAEAMQRARIAETVQGVERTDLLTRLPNRQAVVEALRLRLDRGAAAATGFSLYLVNLDRFEAVNTRVGLQGGDVVLREAARRLQDYVARTDVQAGLVARVGGDEFIIVFDGIHSHVENTVTGAKIVEILSAPFLLPGQTVHVGASVGVLSVTDANAYASDILHDAALAMREAKRLGGSRHVVFNHDTRELALAAARLEHDLREAIAGGQLYLVYQPIVPLRAEARMGAEALVRWQHPTRGLVAPDEFIAIAETSGLIVPLGLLVLEQACQQFRAWKSSMSRLAPAKISVNVSRAQLHAADFVEQVLDVLARTGTDPGCLQLEITETLAAQDNEIRTRLQRLKRAGIRIALDDFGTGYSSLATLHQLPVDVVKIDKAFVRQMTTSPHHRVLVEATLMVATSLGMETVAEGVETREQALMLKLLKCDAGQGFFYSRPVPAGQFETLLAGCGAERKLA